MGCSFGGVKNLESDSTSNSSAAFSSFAELSFESCRRTLLASR